jgi:glycosyltransferase involved in cell wall biosynthesis
VPRRVSGSLFQPQFTAYLPNENVNKWVIRVHDIFPLTNPEWFYPWATSIFRRSIKVALKRNAYIVCSSRTTQNAILSLFPDAEDKLMLLTCVPRELSCIPCGNCDICSQKRILAGHYLLAVGTIEPRKGFDRLIRFWTSDENPSALTLCIVGRRGWKTKKTLEALRAAKNVIWISNACDFGLSKLYAEADAFISSSLDEGFNLPALEARANYRLPLILSDIPIHREYHANSAMFYSNNNELSRILNSEFKKPLVWDSPNLKEQVEVFKNLFR